LKRFNTSIQDPKSITFITMITNALFLNCKRPIFLISGLLLISLVFSSCRSAKIQKPVEHYLKLNDSLSPSYITIPIETPVADLEKMLNKQISGLVYADTSLDNNGGDNLMVKAWKQENIKISLNNNVLSYTVPLKLWIKAGWKISKFGFEVGDFREMNAAISLKFKSTITLNSDWSLNTNTVSDGFDWISTPVLKIGPIDVPITYIANLILKANQTKLTTAIDKGFMDNVNLRSYMLDSWNALQEPRKVNDTYNLWVKIIPQGILTTPISGKNGKLIHTISIKSTTQAFVGAPPDKGPILPLPKLTIQNQIPSDFQVNLWTELPFVKANELATGYLQGKTFTEGKRSVTINHISLYGEGEKLVIYLILTGSYQGELYLEGTPVYNATKQAIELSGLDYHVSTKQFIVKSASWLFKSTLINMVSQNLAFPIADELKEAKALTESNMKDYQLAEGVLLNARLKDLDILDIGIRKESIHLLVGINGKLNLSIRP